MRPLLRRPLASLDDPGFPRSQAMRQTAHYSLPLCVDIDIDYCVLVWKRQEKTS
jgi:hypothetical protein